ncbi:transposase [Caldilinea sp.]|jgi:hypothetical protein|uniref:transposase n=2 Tax=Caldilinea TaxID=233191 RepID=UPI0006948349|nr:transposase [Caldilinea sp.]
MTGRVTMLGISRWADKGGSYRTVQRWFNKVLPWAQIGWLFFRTHLYRPGEVYLAVGDERVSKPGDEAGKGKAGRPQGSKNKDKRQVEWNGELRMIERLVRQLLTLIGGLFPLTYLVLDGHFGNNNVCQMVQQRLGLHLISKLRNDAALYFEYEDEQKKSGRRRRYGDRLHYRAIPERDRMQTTQDKHLRSDVYQARMLHCCRRLGFEGVLPGSQICPGNHSIASRIARYEYDCCPRSSGCQLGCDSSDSTCYHSTIDFVEGIVEYVAFHETVNVLNTVKPPRLLQRALQIATSADSDDIVLDFFDSSATTAYAVLRQNRADGGNRRFIMVQLPEPTPPDSPAQQAGFATIADIGKERIRCVIQRLQAEDAGKLLIGRDAPEDLGFRVYKLGRSHYKAWRNYDGDDLDALQILFARFESPLVEGWQPEALLIEVLLMEGFPLDSAVETIPAFTRNRMRRVSSDLVAHGL